MASSFNKKVVDPLKRIRIMQLLCAFALSILIARLWYLQGLHGSYYRDKSENNRIRTLRIKPPRGRIFDRNMEVLVKNRPSFSVGIMPEDTEDPLTLINNIAQILNVDPKVLSESFNAKSNSRRFEPRIILRDLDKHSFYKLKAVSYRLPGIVFEMAPERVYPSPLIGSHIFGYVREVNKEQLDVLPKDTYKIGDLIGKNGIEREYENILRGQAGLLQVEVDARGRRKQELGRIPYISGRDIKLTIDVELQATALKALEGRRGAVAAIDPRNGEVLVLTSSPSFDANIFSGPLSQDNWSKLNKDVDRPLTNRAISSVYPPGSTIKLLYGLAGLNEHIISEDDTIFCPGSYSLGSRRYQCHKRGGHGAVNLSQAIRGSCNVFFYDLGQKLGINRLHKYLALFGFGSTTGLDIGGEEPGIAPSVEWKARVHNDRWYKGDTVPVSIGQGYFVATPLQMAYMSMLIANGGQKFTPRLIKAVMDDQGIFQDLNPEYRGQILPGAKFEAIRRAAVSVVEDNRGTGNNARIPGASVGGKTGTAQVTSRANTKENTRTQDHAWFVGFGSLPSPTMAIAVIVENAGHGGSMAAPVARAVMEAYFIKNQIIPPKDTDIIQQISATPEDPTRSIQ